MTEKRVLELCDRYEKHLVETNTSLVALKKSHWWTPEEVAECREFFAEIRRRISRTVSAE